MATLQKITKGLDTKEKTYIVSVAKGDWNLTRLAA